MNETEEPKNDRKVIKVTTFIILFLGLFGYFHFFPFTEKSSSVSRILISALVGAISSVIGSWAGMLIVKLRS
jgi:hypothetical protein